MTVLLTGAAGLIGREVRSALAANGMAPVALPREIDLRLGTAIAVLARATPDTIVHSAAVLPPTLSGEAAEAAAAQNRAMDDVVFAAARALRCPVIYFSGTSLYGCVQHVCSEDAPINPRGPYLIEKHRSEGKVLELPGGGVVLRVSSPYGRRQRSATVLNKFVQRASIGEDLFYDGSGAREQDFVAALDVGRAAAAAAAARARGVFNIASGRGVSMKELATLVIAAAGTGAQARPAGIPDPEEDCRTRIDISTAARTFDWHPAVAIEAGIRDLVADAKASLSDPSARVPHR